MRAYTLYFKDDVMEFILRQKPAERQKLIRFLYQLTEDPFQEGDDFVFDEDDHRHEVIMTGRYRIVFWTDHPVNEVKVCKIEAI